MTALRVAQLGDLDQIASLEVEIFGANAWSHAAVLAECSAAAGSSRHFIVATRDGLVAGYAVMMCAGDTADILRIAVRREHRRERRASALLAALVDIARLHGCRRIVLEVGADNSAALRFYAAWGFADIHRRRGYYAGGVDALVLNKPL